MNIWLYVYLIGSAFALLVLLFMVCSMRVHVSCLKDFYGSLRDKWAQTEARARKMEKAVEWFLSYPDFIDLDDCVSLIDDPDYADGDGNLPDIHDLDEVCDWLRYRAQSGSSDQYYPNAENIEYWGENFYTRINK